MNFIRIGNIALDLAKISSVQFYENEVTVFMSCGGHHTFRGEDAQAIERLFRPAAPQTPSQGDSANE
jgi:hypothetical protein